MDYSEFIKYVAERIASERCNSIRGVHDIGKPKRYFDVAYNAALECRPFFEKLSLDEGPHNNYDPSSRASSQAYSKGLLTEIALAFAKGIASACQYDNNAFANKVLTRRLGVKESISDLTFAQYAVRYCSNITFERTCAGCGAKYKVTMKAQSYNLSSEDHPPTCSAKPSLPLTSLLAQIPQQPLSNSSTMNQLVQLHAFASRLGMSGAATVIETILKRNS